MLRKLYDWMMVKAKGKTALAVLAFVSFVDSSVFPLPPDLMLVPMCLANRRRAFWLALVCTLASVAGAVLGYGIGLFAYATVGKWILSLYGGADTWLVDLQDKFNHYYFWEVLVAGFTPFPFKVLTILSGVLKADLRVLVLGSFIARGGRFFLEALLVHFFGDTVQRVVEKYFEAISIGFVVCLVGGFFLVKLFI